MLAKKCDICGAFFVDEEKAVNDEHDENNLILRRRTKNGFVQTCDMDICPDCVNGLHRMFDERRKGHLGDMKEGSNNAG